MITIYGEILIDMNKVSNKESFDYFVGGAPFNVAYSVIKSNGDAKFIGNVGNDLMGKHIKTFVRSKNMDDSLITVDELHNTTLAFVMNDESGERNFCFARKNGADYYIKEESLKEIENSDLIHIGSLMLSEEYGFNYANKIIKFAKQNNKKLSFDINYRDDIFENKNDAIKKYKAIYEKCDIIKISNDELELFTNEKDLLKGLKKFSKDNQKIFVTLGKEGSCLYQNDTLIKEESINVTPVDTTGAGDAFYGTVLSFIDQEGYETFFSNEKIIRKYLRLANIQGALATLKKGALSGVVDLEELLKY